MNLFCLERAIADAYYDVRMSDQAFASREPGERDTPNKKIGAELEMRARAGVTDRGPRRRA